MSLSTRRAPIRPPNRSREIEIYGHTKAETPVTPIRNRRSHDAGIRT